MKKRILRLLETHPGILFRQRDLYKRLRISPEKRNKFKEILTTLVEEGSVNLVKGNKYCLPKKVRTVEGRLIVNQKGFGFVVTDDSRPDIFVSRWKLGNAVNGDRVQVRLRKGNRTDRLRGAITHIIERKTDRFIGTVETDRGGDWLSIVPVTPERGIRILKKNSVSYSQGQVVVAKVEDWGTFATPISVKIIDIIGDGNDPGNDFRIILEKYGYSTEFPSEVVKRVHRFNPGMIEKEIPNRRDLRGLKTMTIDPETARDFDDAVSIEKIRNGYRLGIHIADVSYFVGSGSPLDREAFKRGTSVYFTEGVVHMLPEELAADLCSLQPHKDRLTMTVLIDFDKNWKVIRYEVLPSVIRSIQRFNYQEVQSILDREKTHSLEKELRLLEQLSKALFNQRSEWGSIDFDIPEPIFSLGEQGIPHEIRPSERLQSHRIVEECMLLANRLIAERFGQRNNKNIPFIYRIHDKPDPDDVEAFLMLLKRLNLQIETKHNPATSRGMRDILAGVEDSPYKGLIENVALRSMSKAKYAVAPREHFGLAFRHYTHFTSPIRRYPDLVVHRRIKAELDRETIEDEKLLTILSSITEQANVMELNALDAEREYIKIKQLRWLKERIGESFAGIISGVMNFGFFVELESSMAEGLVHIDTLEDDDYSYNEDNYCIVGRKTQQEYRLGDKVRIHVIDVTLERQRANFVLDN